MFQLKLMWLTLLSILTMFKLFPISSNIYVRTIQINSNLTHACYLHDNTHGMQKFCVATFLCIPQGQAIYYS